MFERSKQTIAGIAAAIALTFAVGVAAAAGLVPQAGTSETASASGPAETTSAAPDVTQPVAAEVAPAEAPATTAAPANTAPKAAPRTTAAPRSAAATPAAAAAPAPAASAPAVPARRTPSSAEVMAAMQALKAWIPALPLNESYARDFGNEVCSSFDQGASFSQVVANAIAAASGIPFFSLSQANAQFAVQTAVSLFCPGHQAKLG